ncbi:MAG TPA: hypothetical protein VGR16_05460 [Thermomicrobiales bacterium]|nr:hypothetical protein [Thermomicrobiales bacterium]
MHDVEIPFTDGNVSATVRVGDTVRRATRPWTPAAHALLLHLEAMEFNGAPRVLRFDPRGRESLTFIPGETAPASLDGYESDETLVGAARLLRRYHDAVRGFQPPSDARGRFTVGAPTTGEVICHNDVAAGTSPSSMISPRG